MNGATILVSAIILAIALACAWAAQQLARHGVHGCAYALSDWLQAVGRGIEHGRDEWERLKKLHSVDGAAERESRPLFSEERT